MFKLSFDASELNRAIVYLPAALAEAMTKDSSLAEAAKREASLSAPQGKTGKLKLKIRVNKPRAGKKQISWTVSPGIYYGAILTKGVPQKYQRVTKEQNSDKKNRSRENYLRRQAAIEKGWRIAPYDFMAKGQKRMTELAPEYTRKNLRMAIANARKAGVRDEASYRAEIARRWKTRIV